MLKSLWAFDFMRKNRLLFLVLEYGKNFEKLKGFFPFFALLNDFGYKVKSMLN